MPDKLKILLVSPTTELEYRDEEISSVVNALQPTLLSGNVSVTRLMEYANRRFDLVWFSTHGTKEGVLLSDGILPTSLLTTIIRSSGADYLYLNTCESFAVALAIHEELKVDLISTVSDLPELAAHVTGSTFAECLADTGVVSEAYYCSKPGQNENYIYLHWREDMYGGSRRSGGLDDMSENDELVSDIKELILMVKGDTNVGLVGIRDNLKILKEEFASFREEYNEFLRDNTKQWLLLESTLKFYRIALFLMLGIFVLTMSGILILLVMIT